MTHRAIVSICVLLAAASAASAGIKLAENGQSRCVIILPEDAIPTEKTAATELQKYFTAITGSKPEIASNDQPRDSTRIYVGPSKQARKLLPDLEWDNLGMDGIVMKTVGHDLVLAGGRPRGTLYAVYTFLEDTCGVRFWTGAETDIPKKPTLEIESLNRVYVPKLRYREVFNHDVIDDNYEFAARMKLNGHMTRIPQEWGGHYTLIGWCHTAFEFMPPDKHFAKHPEWFAMLNGKRSTGGQLCLTNEEMRKEMTRVVLNRIRKHPEAGIISVTQNDGFGPCQCEKCEAVVKEEGSEAGNVIRFVNAVAAEVKKEYPDFLVETLAYVYSRTPPKKVRPADNVLVRLCSIECDFAHPLSSPSNVTFANDLKGWSAISKNLFIWNYVTNFSNYLIPLPNFRPFAEDLRLFTANNVIGVFQQGDAFNDRAGDMLPLRTWLLAHLLWDPAQDQRKLTEEFMNGYYGAAGKPLLEYVDLVNSLAVKPGFIHGCYGAETDFLSDEMIGKFDVLFDRAAQAVPGDARLSERVRREKLVLDHLHILRYPFEKKLAEFNQKGEAPEAMRDAYEKQVMQYAGDAKKLGTRAISEGGDFNSYVPALLGRAQRFAPITLPKPGATLAPGQFDIQEDRFYLYKKGVQSDLVDDPLASNGKAARMPGSHIDWATQFHVSKNDPFCTKGPWKCYLVLRADAKSKSGTAFRYGLYDSERGVVAMDSAGADWAADGKYHNYCILVDELKPKMYFYVIPPGDSNVSGVYLDRIFITK